MNFFGGVGGGVGGGGEGRRGVRQSRCIMGDLQMAYFSFFFIPLRN